MKYGSSSTVKTEIVHPIILEDIKEVIKRSPMLERLQGKTLLITGAGGLLASYLIYTVAILNEFYFKVPCYVISITRRPYAQYKRLAKLIDYDNFEFITLNLGSSAIMPINKPIHFIIHAASNASPIKYFQDPLDTAKSNTLGLIDLLELARTNPVEAFLFFSSGQIYGSPPEEMIPTPEYYAGQCDPLEIRACYDQSKRFGETLCAIYYRQFQIPVKIVRPFQIYGPGLDPSDMRAFSEFSYCAARGEPIILRSRGKVRRSFCYITDGTTAFWHALFDGEPAQAYNVGCSKPLVTIEYLANMISKIANPPVQVIKNINKEDTYLSGAPEVTCPDIGKIMRLMQSESSVGIEEGFRRVYRWLKDTVSSKDAW